MPRSANPEYRTLVKRSRTPLLPLVVNSIAQALYIDGYRRADLADPVAAWQWWQANGMDARQSAITRAALGYGTSYVSVIPGTDPDGAAVPVIRGHSPRRAHALYEDAGDDWPTWFIRTDPTRVRGKSARVVRLYDDIHEHEFRTGTSTGDRLEYVASTEHGAGVVPAVAFRVVPDLEGRADGVVHPLLDLADRLNQSIFDLLVAASFSSFKVRTVSGMVPTLDANGKPIPLNVDARRLLMAKDPDTRFSQLDETDLRQLIDNADAAIRHLAVIAQVPPSDLVGNLSNLAADAIAAAKDSQNRQKTELQYVLGERWEQVLRLAARIAGDDAGARDMAAQVSWRDVEGRSLAQIADALGKLAQSLGVPVEGLWSRIPGVSQTDIQTWQRLRMTDRASDPMTRLADRLGDGADTGGGGGSGALAIGNGSN